MSDSVNLADLFGAPKAETFLGLERSEDLDEIAASAALIGAPCATPYEGAGPYCRNAPAALRAAASHLAANLDRHNFDLGGPTFPAGTLPAVDCGDLPWDASDFEGNRNTIRAAVSKVLSRGVVPVIMGGDDSVPIPMLAALGQTGHSYTILQIDAHIDWRKEHMGETLGLSSTMRRASEMTHIGQIIQVGARGIGSAHSDDLADALNWGATIIPAREFHSNGVPAVLDHIATGSQVIICLDVDAMDPSIVPGVIGRSPGGLSYYDTLDLIMGVAAKGQIAAANVVEYMPEADVDGLGALTVSRLMAAMLGVLARQQAEI